MPLRLIDVSHTPPKQPGGEHRLGLDYLFLRIGTAKGVIASAAVLHMSLPRLSSSYLLNKLAAIDPVVELNPRISDLWRGHRT